MEPYNLYIFFYIFHHDCIWSPFSLKQFYINIRTDEVSKQSAAPGLNQSNNQHLVALPAIGPNFSLLSIVVSVGVIPIGTICPLAITNEWFPEHLLPINFASNNQFASVSSSETSLEHSDPSTSSVVDGCCRTRPFEWLLRKVR